MGLVDFLLARIAEDRDRLLAESEAKRRAVNECVPSRLQDYDESAEVLAVAVLGSLAFPYADHPDYRDEWRP